MLTVLWCIFQLKNVKLSRFEGLISPANVQVMTLVDYCWSISNSAADFHRLTDNASDRPLMSDGESLATSRDSQIASRHRKSPARQQLLTVQPRGPNPGRHSEVGYTIANSLWRPRPPQLCSVTSQHCCLEINKQQHSLGNRARSACSFSTAQVKYGHL